MTDNQLWDAIVVELAKLNVDVMECAAVDPCCEPSPVNPDRLWIWAYDCEYGTRVEILAHEAMHAIQTLLQKDRIARPLGDIFRTGRGVLRYAAHIKVLRENYPHSSLYKYYLDERNVEVEAFSMMDRPELVYAMLLEMNK